MSVSSQDSGAASPRSKPAPTSGLPLAVLASLVWAAHIGLDRLLGYGLKYPDAFGHTHLTPVSGGLTP